MEAQLAVQNMTMSTYVYEVFPPDNFPRVVCEIGIMMIIIIRTGGTCRRYHPQREMVIRACQASVGFSVRVLKC